MPRLTREARQNSVVANAMRAIEQRPKDLGAILQDLYSGAWRDAECFHGVKPYEPDEEIYPNEGAERNRADKKETKK